MASNASLQLTLTKLDTPLGPALVALDRRERLRAFDWLDHEERLYRLLRRRYGSTPNPVVGEMPSRIRERFAAYFDGELAALNDLDVKTAGTPFQQKVWSSLRQIPAGQTQSYRQLAESVGRPTAFRAVGLANGSNPVGLVVPCHRVIGADGSLTGYGGGLHRKRWLLEHEGVPIRAGA
jgi:methylated-DNA-[protein]-cysteine S-methyltransferase